MTQPQRQPERDASGRAPDWIARLCQERLASGGVPDHAGALEALKRFKAALAQQPPFGLSSDEEIEDFIDANGGDIWHIDTWPLVPWSYWEARGAGPYRR